MSAMRATPPITPPAIAPVFVSLPPEEDEGADDAVAVVEVTAEVEVASVDAEVLGTSDMEEEAEELLLLPAGSDLMQESML